MKALVIALVCVLVSCASAQQFLTKMELELDDLTGMTQLDNTNGTAVVVTIHNATDNSIVVSRYAAAGVYLPNMTIVMGGGKFNLSYNTKYTYNLSTDYGDFLYNFTTPAYRVDTSDANATASQILSGYTAYVDGSKLTGSIITQTLSALTTTVLAGYYDAANLSVVDPDLASGNIKSGATIFGIAGNSNVLDTTGATATNDKMLSGYTCYAAGNLRTGSIATQTLSSSSVTVPAGYYSAANLSVVNSNLTAGNIKSGVDIFGIPGSYVGGGGGVELHSGQQTCWDTGGTPRDCAGTGEDADIDAATAKSFTPNGDGTVTDTQTGIMWQQSNTGYTLTWQAALDYCNNGALCNDGSFQGSGDCSGNGGTKYDDWHLPNVLEMATLIDYGRSDFKNPALTWGYDYFWTSTSNPSWPDVAYVADFLYGYIARGGKGYDGAFVARCARSAG